MITIYFEGHARTYDNEADIASGHHDVELSEAGRKQAIDEKAPRYTNVELDKVFTSDTKRAYETAQIMFSGESIPIIQDARLRECDYGDLTRRPRQEMETVRANSITKPFPNGESYENVMQRIKSFLDDLKRGYDGKTVMIVGHMATYCGLEHWIVGRSIAELIASQPQIPSKYHHT